MIGGYGARGRLRPIRTASIRVHELDVTVPLQKQVDAYRRVFEEEAEAGRPRPEDGVPAVRVGSVGGVPYLMADGDIYRGALAAGTESIRCAVTKCADISDFLVRHVRYNHRPAGINPLLLRRVSDYVAMHGSEKDAAALSRTCRGTIHQRFLALNLEPGAAAVLGQLCAFLGTKLSQFVLPYYIPHHVSRQRPDMQEELAREVSGLVRTRPVTDARFAWPGPEEIEILSDSPRYRPEGESAVVVTPEGESASPKEVRRAERLIKNARDAIVIPGTDAHPPYLVDLKTRRVSAVDDREAVTVLREADPEGKGSAAYLFPRKAGRWLGLAGGKKDGADVRMARFDAATSLAEFAQRHRDARGVVFYRGRGDAGR